MSFSNPPKDHNFCQVCGAEMTIIVALSGKYDRKTGKPITHVYWACSRPVPAWGEPGYISACLQKHDSIRLEEPDDDIPF